MTEQWSEWLPHDGSGLPADLYGKTVEVRTTGPFTGNAPDGTSALGIAGVTLIRSWHWTAESRVLPVDHPGWRASLPIDEYRVLGRSEEQEKELLDHVRTGATQDA